MTAQFIQLHFVVLCVRQLCISVWWTPVCTLEMTSHVKVTYIYISGKQMRVKLVSQRKKTRIHIQLSVKLASRISLLSSLLNLNLCAGKLLCTLLHQLTCPHLETVWLVPRVHSYCCIKYCLLMSKNTSTWYLQQKGPSRMTVDE